MPSNKRLNPRQQVFCIEYVKLLNNLDGENSHSATEAARRAGYSPIVAAEMASENLRKPHVQKEIERLTNLVELDMRLIFGQHAYSAFQGHLSDLELLENPKLKMVKILGNGEKISYPAIQDAKVLELRKSLRDRIIDLAGWKPVEKVITAGAGDITKKKLEQYF